MSDDVFEPTSEQKEVIRHASSAFITACPGAGKTRVMVERTRYILKASHDGRGFAFLSFTRAAVSELENRLRQEVLLSSPVFPHFIGTFDSFIWQFLIAPFGIPDTKAAPRLIPDKRSRTVQPYAGAQSLDLSCFDRTTGKIDAAAAGRLGFKVSEKEPRDIRAYETSAQKLLALFRARGELDFDDARDLAVARLDNRDFAVRFSSLLIARFGEIIVDEAQDCNPADLKIIQWLRDAGIPTKVICDPHQSIYEFRGGITDQLFAFADTFDTNDRLSMSGNFRCNGNICKAIVMLRATQFRDIVDEPLGKYKDEQVNIYILSYAGRSVPGTIGRKFEVLLGQLNIDVTNAPVLAATRNSSSCAIGEPTAEARKDMTFRLAEAVKDFYFSFESGNQKLALEEVHRVILELEGRLSDKSYHQCVTAHEITPGEWRPQALHILHALRYDPEVFADVDTWLNRARDLLAPYLPENGPSISQKLKRNEGIARVLVQPPVKCPPAKTIHSVKGKEFPAVCVVTVPQTFKGILDYLETSSPADKAEMARELYVAASRAQRLLVFATPAKQSNRFAAHLRLTGAAVTVLEI